MTVQLDVPVTVKVVITKKALGYRLSLAEHCREGHFLAAFIRFLHLIYCIVDTLHRYSSLSQGSMTEIRKITDATEKLVYCSLSAV